MKTFLIIAAHIIGVGLLLWGGISLNNLIVKCQSSYPGVISVFSVALSLYITFLNVLYQRNQAFHLLVNRLRLLFTRTHTYWQPHITMTLDRERLGDSAILERIWETLSEGTHGLAQRKSISPTTLTVVLDELLVVRFRLDENRLFMDFEQKLLVPSHLYDSRQRWLATLTESVTKVVRPNAAQCGLRISFPQGVRNPYYGFFVNRVPPELLQDFQATFRLDAKSSCRVEAGKDQVNIEGTSLVEVFDALLRVLTLKALPAGDNP